MKVIKLRSLLRPLLIVNVVSSPLLASETQSIQYHWDEENITKAVFLKKQRRTTTGGHVYRPVLRQLCCAICSILIPFLDSSGD